MSTDQSDDPVLQIRNLSIDLPRKADRRHAVREVDLTLRRGEILCVVGETGSGKSVMASAIMNAVAPGLTISSGEVLFKGEDVPTFSDEKLRDMRGAKIAMIYQKPMAALNPAMKVGNQVDEVSQFHRPEIDRAGRRAFRQRFGRTPQSLLRTRSSSAR